MTENNDYLLLKWGTIKGYCLENSNEAWELMKKYNELGTCMSVMAQRDTIEQKELICKIIDSVKGPVTNDWSGEDYTENRELAKKYVLEYRMK